ncbi:MAG: FAD-dependent oxidoreductase [Clostridium sp.]|uniref:NAD(P)/FAD-dependent oxidoreductase n=1 Tax=Clostridium sp. TaxID=1506 RepID=UPI0025BCD65D|nr:FAD-dependent oxidoreductase [Clostridium sp.]MCF0148093.1 FAD-dependent oxidoreductase [Clostridium sp.]
MKYVIIGASAAGINAARTLRQFNKECKITLVSKDEYVYSRCILHHFLDGRRDIEDLDFTPDNFFHMYDIEWIKGTEVVGIEVKDKKIILDNGKNIGYDKLLLSAGASSFLPPIENLRTANNVIGLRNLDDAIKMKEMSSKVKNIAILGAGLVGVDALAGLLDYGANLTLIEMGDRLLPLQLDKYAASKYEERLIKEGVNLKFGVKAEKVVVDENNNPVSIMLNTGEEIPCELIIACAGVRANIGFLKDSGIECDRFGLIINEKGETNVRDIYGAGDITGRNPIWPIAVKEGMIAANNMVGKETFMEDFFASKNTMNFCGLATMSLGLVTKPDDTYEEIIDIDGKDYKKVIIKDGAIYGAIIQGDLSYVGVLTQLIKEKINVNKVKKPLFDVDYSDFFNETENLQFVY